MKQFVMAVLVVFMATALFIGCDNGTTSSAEISTLDKVSNVEEVVFPTFSDPDASKSIIAKAADLESVDNHTDGNPDTSEAYNYIENINDSIMVVLTNSFLDAIKEKIEQGADFADPTFVEFMNGDMEIDCTLKVDETGERVVFYGYVDRSWPGEGGTVSSIPDSPAEMSFASDFSDIIMQVSEEDSTGDLYEKVAYDYGTKSGFFASFKDETEPLFAIEQIISDSDNSITFRMLSNETNAESPYNEGFFIDLTKYDIFMYSLYQEGIKYYNGNGDESPIETYYTYNGNDGSSLDADVKNALDTKITTLINDGTTAETIYNSIPSANLNDNEDLLTAHQQHFQQ